MNNKPKLWTFLASLPIVNLKALWLIPCDVFTMGLLAVLSFVRHTPDASGLFDSWLLLLGAAHGVVGGAYVAKRLTSQDGNADEQPVPGDRAQDYAAGLPPRPQVTDHDRGIL